MRSTHSVDLGSDHKTIFVTLRLSSTAKKKREPRTQKRERVKWNDVCQNKYMENANRILEDLILAADLEKKCEQIEEALRTGASMSKITNKSEPKYPGEDQQYLVLQSLLHQRRSSTTRGEERTRLSKLIQKEIKAIKKLQRRSQISITLYKFRRLREIFTLKSRKIKNIVCIHDRQKRRRAH